MQLFGETLKKEVVRLAIEEGFTLAKVCKPNSIPEAKQKLLDFVNLDRHGQMGWMKERLEWRGDPTVLWPKAKSVLMLAESYAPDHDPLEILEHKERAAISVYAQNRDYHELVKKRLKRLGRKLIEIANGPEIKVFVDTAPVMEKPLGASAGLGWQGKHTNLVSRELGNWFFLGAIFTTADLPEDSPEIDHCGSCTACLDVCPTDAFPAPYQLDARKCISYLTIEHSGPVDVNLRPKIGNRIYGCDDCLAVCPWNKFAVEASEIGYAARAELKMPKLSDLAQLDDANFRHLFSKNPIKRIGRNRFVRNVLYAIGNSKEKDLVPAAKKLMNDKDEAVSEAAKWAVDQLEGSNE